MLGRCLVEIFWDFSFVQALGVCAVIVVYVLGGGCKWFETQQARFSFSLGSSR